MGGNIGGPLSIPLLKGTRGKLFFFVSSEEIREKRPKTPQNVTVPTPLERQGNFTQSIISGKVVTVKDPTTGDGIPRQHRSGDPHPAIHPELPEPAAAAEHHQYRAYQPGSITTRFKRA